MTRGEGKLGRDHLREKPDADPPREKPILGEKPIAGPKPCRTVIIALENITPNPP
jgi:hypothetical protein